jgi:hypothetical protein
VINWRMMRERPAPSAARTASSRRRMLERASKRLAMLTQVMSSTIATAATRTSNGR